MNQVELVAAISDRTDISKSDIDSILKTVGAIVQEQLPLGGDIALPGIGKLKTRQSAARTGRNPKTGDVLDIPAKTKAIFVVAKSLKDALQ
ncbi:HU family DNA-binding protein [Glaciimonas immobilis]|uniref:DNA-binding protein HU-beta n=1 Tax=Glaciimonas immobilis TaxID=728004 RepID=A0A840RPA1_9BURK|nr:HU family DNA-binding protein [Glaciimonas immobilis]KAF3999034.1 HU family DNA-binding protein [Glaciimonas immobilis]MBB5198461.1 DNA-binding protein HU-beta [Glaciimonas immobilis]